MRFLTKTCFICLRVVALDILLGLAIAKTERDIHDAQKTLRHAVLQRVSEPESMLVDRRLESTMHLLWVDVGVLVIAAGSAILLFLSLVRRSNAFKKSNTLLKD